MLLGIAVSGLAQAQETKAGAVPPWTEGLASAPVTIEFFYDYQCPPCGIFNPDLNKIVKAFPHDVQVIFRNFPLTKLHPFALPAAQAAEAAGRQGQFLAMKELLFSRHDKWWSSKDPKELFVSYAKELGLDVAQFRLDLKSEEVSYRIKSDQERGGELGVNGTPTIFMNGQMVEPADTNYERLAVLISKALK